jgi:quinol monooxygenase YgiN
MLVFVNQFSVSRSADEFELAFRTTSEFMRQQDGFLRHRLVRSLQVPNRYVNIAEWEDEESFQSAIRHPDFGRHASELRILAASEPHLCVPVLEIGNS